MKPLIRMSTAALEEVAATEGVDLSSAETNKERVALIEAQREETAKQDEADATIKTANADLAGLEPDGPIGGDSPSCDGGMPSEEEPTDDEVQAFADELTQHRQDPPDLTDEEVAALEAGGTLPDGTHGLDLDPSIPQGPHEADLSTAPHYVCHREVMALKIVAADDSDPLCALLHFGCGAFIQVDRGWFAKNEPEAGGYFVFGLDHWAPSYVSAENFEQSFTRARSPLA